jgi:hypothetical protein
VGVVYDEEMLLHKDYAWDLHALYVIAQKPVLIIFVGIASTIELSVAINNSADDVLATWITCAVAM